MKVVFRPHDDTDGDRGQGLVLIEAPDGDMWVQVRAPEGTSLRFRMPFIGGGASAHTFEALRHLQAAMTADNDGRPMVAPDTGADTGGNTDALLAAMARDHSWAREGDDQDADGHYRQPDLQAMARELLAARRRLQALEATDPNQLTLPWGR